MICTRTAVIAIAGIVSLVSWAVAKGPTFTDAENAGIDHKFQGEYEGDVANGNKWGANIIALGKGKFKSIGYRGGLPGHGWKGEPGQYHSGEHRDGVVVIQADEFVIKVTGENLTVFGVDGKRLAELKKQHRESPTLGKKPPAGAIVLFDGTSIDQWSDAKLVEDKYLGATSCYTKKKFGDHELHVEFRTPFMPEATGQARGNSGVYVQSRYEIQVLDSFGLEGKDNECGGIYKISRPLVNMCYPPLRWQTYDIDFVSAKYDKDEKKTQNARVTIRHNGVVIHDDLELPYHTAGRYSEFPGAEALFLQNHGNPVVYRNIWVVEK